MKALASTSLGRFVSSELEKHSIRRHRSRLGWRDAPRYTRYLDRCRRESPVDTRPAPIIAAALDLFRREGIASFWTEQTGAAAQSLSRRIAEQEKADRTVWKPGSLEGYYDYAGDPWIDFAELEALFRGDLGDFLRAYFEAPFKILYGTLYHTEHVDKPQGSQLWHSDGGPGICVNVMYYLHDTTPANGTLEAIPWSVSYELFRKEKQLSRLGKLEDFGADRRERICRFYENEIKAHHRPSIRQPSGPAGLVVPFLNNTVHRGGYPTSGHSRTAMVFHCYPSHRATNFERYRTSGIKKTVPYPQDPAAEF